MSDSQEKPIVFLKGRRVTLRPVLESDIPHAIRWINDPEVSYYLGAYLPVTEAGEKDWFEKSLKLFTENKGFQFIDDAGLKLTEEDLKSAFSLIRAAK